jgi:hypothetical protein
LSKKTNSETYSTLKKKYNIENETDSFLDQIEELTKKAETHIKDFFYGKLDRAQTQVLINKLPAVLFFIEMKADDRLEQNQRWRKFSKRLNENWLRKISDILEDDHLIEFLHIKVEDWKKKQHQLKSDISALKKQRSGYNKDLEFVLKPIFILLKGFKVTQSDQVQFIHFLFKNLGHKEYGGVLERGTLERIRKMQERAINALKLDL